MNRISWKESVELIGIAAIVASLVFVGMQLQQDRKLAYAEATTSVVGSATEIVGLINSNHEAWIRGLDGEELAPADELAFGAMARLYYRMYSLRYYRAGILGTPSKEFVVQQYTFYLYQYPGLRRAFEEFSVQAEFRNTAFGQEGFIGFRQMVGIDLSDLDDRAPPIPPRNYILF